MSDARAGRFAELGILVRMAFRNLFASRLKTLIVGGIVLFGAVLVLVGSSLLDSMNAAMSRSIIGSVAGHLQVYAAKSRDELALWGNLGGESELAQIDDFARLKKTLEAVPNVKTVVPMGVSGAIVTSGNTIDVTLAKLRDAVRRRREGDASAPAAAELEAEKAHVREIVTILQEDLKNLKVMSERAMNPEDQAAVARAAGAAFWDGFDKDPYGALEFLENRIAPLTTDGDVLYIRYVGTDPAAFTRSFDRLKIVDGQAIPPGRRGFLFAKFFYEERLKLKAARRLDKIREAIEEKHQTIATDDTLKRYVRENTKEVREIQLQLDAIKTAQVRELLRGELGSSEPEVAKLLAAFFAMDDATFARRYRFFYDRIVPLIDLYRIRVGDTLTIKGFTKTGYMQSVNVKVWGTFDFAGLEKSALAGSLNLIDLISFRELYGFLTAEKSAEIDEIKSSSGAREVSREDAERALFGGAPEGSGDGAPGKTVVASATPGLETDTPETDRGTFAQKLRREELASRVYGPDELEGGVVLNAAVILSDPTKLAETRAAIEQASKTAGLDLKVLSWQEASGLIGQMVLLLRVVLYVAVLIIFTVALVIINNAMVMATLERVQEIGTLRAIGAQRRFILRMLLVEAIAVGLAFGALGAGLGAAIVWAIGRKGIPATTDAFYFFFSGPRLHPFLGTSNLAAAFAIVLVVSAFSSLYPAWLAMRISPRQAMQTEE